jgi:hypothetical protein
MTTLSTTSCPTSYGPWWTAATGPTAPAVRRPAPRDPNRNCFAAIVHGSHLDPVAAPTSPELHCGSPAGHPITSSRRRQHPLDRPALATPVQQGLDPDARPLRPRNQGERLPVPREHVTAAAWYRGRRSGIAGRPGMGQVHGLVEPSPLGVLAQRQVGLSFQPAPELLVAEGTLAGRGVRPGASLVGQVRLSSTSTQARCTAAQRGRSVSGPRPGCG